MKFDTPATTNPIDQLKVVGKPADRIDGPLKTTGTAPYAYERHDVAPNQAYGYVVGAAIAKGRIASMDLGAAKAAPGVLAIVTARERRQARQGQLQHRQAARRPGDRALPPGDRARRRRDLRAGARRGAAGPRRLCPRPRARSTSRRRRTRRPSPAGIIGGPADTAVGDFAGAFAAAPVQLDATYTTPDQAHAMMEPHASIAAWDGDKLTLWTSNQMIDWSAARRGEDARHRRRRRSASISPFIGGGFGGKLFAARRRAAGRARRARGAAAGEGGAARGR